ncbi:hypothetical protein HG531_002574 [Fusarium graminearum]|nr:hypothetical protein HG531_002574 [Fusarium graminearum]
MVSFRAFRRKAVCTVGFPEDSCLVLSLKSIIVLSAKQPGANGLGALGRRDELILISILNPRGRVPELVGFVALASALAQTVQEVVRYLEPLVRGNSGCAGEYQRLAQRFWERQIEVPCAWAQAQLLLAVAMRLMQKSCHLLAVAQQNCGGDANGLFVQ